MGGRGLEHLDGFMGRMNGYLRHELIRDELSYPLGLIAARWQTALDELLPALKSGSQLGSNSNFVQKIERSEPGRSYSIRRIWAANWFLTRQ